MQGGGPRQGILAGPLVGQEGRGEGRGLEGGREGRGGEGCAPGGRGLPGTRVGAAVSRQELQGPAVGADVPRRTSCPLTLGLG